jgi:hypothetical protein
VFSVLKAFRLIDLHAAIHFAPAVAGLIRNADLFADLADGVTLTEQHIGFPTEKDLSICSQAELNKVARHLDLRFRRTLDYKTPADRLNLSASIQ